MLGEGNFLRVATQGAPIAITAEGAKHPDPQHDDSAGGATRRHPYVLEEMAAAQNNDVDAFDKLLFKRLGHMAA